MECFVANLVSVAGASNVVLGSVVAYQTELKSSILGVNRSLLKEQGAVDPEVAAQMAEGIRSRFSLQCNAFNRPRFRSVNDWSRWSFGAGWQASGYCLYRCCGSSGSPGLGRTFHRG